jgi:hypothetical protein
VSSGRKRDVRAHLVGRRVDPGGVAVEVPDPDLPGRIDRDRRRLPADRDACDDRLGRRIDPDEPAGVEN